jgi:hypothetical protein
MRGLVEVVKGKVVNATLSLLAIPDMHMGR